MAFTKFILKTYYTIETIYKNKYWRLRIDQVTHACVWHDDWNMLNNKYILSRREKENLEILIRAHIDKKATMFINLN